MSPLSPIPARDPFPPLPSQQGPQASKDPATLAVFAKTNHDWAGDLYCSAIRFDSFKSAVVAMAGIGLRRVYVCDTCTANRRKYNIVVCNIREFTLWRMLSRVTLSSKIFSCFLSSDKTIVTHARDVSLSGDVNVFAGTIVEYSGVGDRERNQNLLSCER